MRTRSISVLATTFSILATGIASTANASVANLLDICTSYHNSTNGYFSKIELLGWKEVIGSQGEKVIDRTIWVRVPHFKSNFIDSKNPMGAMHYEQHMTRLTLGHRIWQHAPNTIVQSKAFVSEGAALYVFLKENHKYPNSSFLEDVIYCNAIFPKGTKSDEMLNIILNTNRFNGKIHLKKLPSGIAQTTRIGPSLVTDIIPVQNGSLTQYVPDQNILQSANLALLNYTTGFQSSFTYRYNEVTP